MKISYTLVFVALLIGMYSRVIAYSEAKELIVQGLKDQVARYKRVGFTHDDIQRVAHLAGHHFWIAHYHICHGRLYGACSDHPVAKSRFNALARVIARILARQELHDCEFLVYLSDKIRSDLEQAEKLVACTHVPLFLFSKDMQDPYERDLPLLPDPYLLADLPALIAPIKQACIDNPWCTKIEKAFFRGATSGGAPYSWLIEHSNRDYIENCIEHFVDPADAFDVEKLIRTSKLPRLTIAMLSCIFPEYIDAKISSYILFADNPSGKKLHDFLVKTVGDPVWTSPVDHLKFKYLVSIDGTTAAWARPVWIMMSNSVLLMQQTTQMQFFYPALKPYEHYVPLDYTMGNLVEIVDWLRKHDEQAQQISKRAHEIVEQLLMPQDLEQYIAIALNEYSLVQKYTMEESELPVWIDECIV